MLHITSNGSRWAGDAPATVAELLEVMAREPLCPSFLAIMDPGDRPFENAARYAKPNPAWLPYKAQPGVPEWLDGDPIYPEAPDAIRFFGNFANLSHVFSIDTDEPAVIEQLRAAIAANMATPAFQAECKARQARKPVCR